jgi:hypothetical protein
MIPSYGEKSSIGICKNIKFNGKKELKRINKMAFPVLVKTVNHKLHE